jgi:hypothetical protein
MNEARSVLEQLRALVGSAMTLEQRARLAQYVRESAQRARVSELELASARLADWLVHHSEWIQANVEAARTNEAVQNILLRGEIIQQNLEHRTINDHPRDKPPLFGPRVREDVVTSLAGMNADWKQRQAQGSRNPS